MTFTKESLRDLVEHKLAGSLFVVVSNREPYVHTLDGDQIKVQVPASGLTTALDPVMKACGGTWIAHGSGDADMKVMDGQQKVSVPPEDPKYSLRRVWLSQEEEKGYYSGFANEALWPLCHIVYTRPVFRESDWKTYKNVNNLFAAHVLSEVGNRKAFVFIQDYHLALVSRLVKERNPSIVTAQFWHIPWPNPEAFRICPWEQEILAGLLGNDLMGFHIRYHCNNFMDTVERGLEARVDRELYEITHRGKKTVIRSYPISVDSEEIDREAQGTAVTAEILNLKQRLGLQDEIIGVGMDRIDYTKGIPDRLKALDIFFDRYPRYKRKVVFIQGGVPSRTQIDAYRALNDEIDSTVERINSKYAAGAWKPILYLKEHLSPLSLMALRRMARFCIVSSLHDGMNLVAKEFVASRGDEDGVLILSPFTGAARELTDAVLVNPFAADHLAEAIRKAVEMPGEERKRRMQKMRQAVRENNVYTWAGDIISDLVKFETGQ